MTKQLATSHQENNNKVYIGRREHMSGNRSRRLSVLCRAVYCLLLLVVCLTGCKTSRRAVSDDGQPRCLSAKVRLTVPNKNASFTVNGTLKLVSGERLQMSFLMPILRTEVVRIEVTPDEVLVVDRMGRRYVRATRDELKNILPRKVTFSHLESLVFNAAKPGSKRSITEKELGISGLETGKIELSDFSESPLKLTPTSLSDRYTAVGLDEVLNLLMNL